MVSLESPEEAMVRRGKIAQGLIALERPDLIDLFLTYQNEALAARKFLENSLIGLKPGAEILEIGGVFSPLPFNWRAKVSRSHQ